MMMRWLDRLPRVISEVIRDELVSFSKVTLDWNESLVASRNRSYTTLFSYQQRQENKAKLACLASEYQFRFRSQLYLYISLCAFPGNSAKNACWRLPTSPPGKQRWRPQTPILGGSISWTTNKSASSRNTAVAFYPFIFMQGRRWMKRYRLVDELYLDWIFSCINRGKIITW